MKCLSIRSLTSATQMSENVVFVLGNCKVEQKISLNSKILSLFIASNEMSRVMRKPTFCICENKDADQLRGNREADQRLCFRYIDSTIPLLSKSKISSL